MSDNITNEMQCAPFDPNEVVDWAAEYESIMQEAWLDDLDPMVDAFDWDGEGLPSQGTAAVLPGDRSFECQTRLNDEDMLDADAPVVQDEAILYNDKTPTLCDIEGCHAGPFGREAELRRHKQQKHMKPGFPCTAIGCNRTGERAFAREDKLKDHILAGHGNNSNFHCPFGCPQILTKDLMGIHHNRGIVWPYTNKVRRCPVPKCPISVKFFGSKLQHMDDLMAHLQTHGTESRIRFKITLQERGYDAVSGQIICPVCLPQTVRFQKHADFYEHSLKFHMHGVRALSDYEMKVMASNRFLKSEENSWNTHSKDFWKVYGGEVWGSLDRWFREAQLPDEVKRHRLVLLSLWPVFGHFPIWDDVKLCNGSFQYD